MTYIDLSAPLDEHTPVYPGDPAIQVQPAGVIERDGYTDHTISLGTHIGTHIDAPLHMIAGGQSLGDIAPDRFIGRGRLIEVGEQFSLDDIRAADLQSGDIVLFRTGLSERYHEPDYFETYPAMSEDIARYLVERRVKMVGVDTGSVDNADGFPVHKILLGGGVLIIENLTNLDQLAGKDFTVYALPLKLDLDGAPTRVIAEVG